MDSTVHGIPQAGILEWVAFPFSRGSSQPRDQTQVSHIAGGYFTSWATREAPQDSEVQFIMPAGPRGISSQQGLWYFWEDQFYTPHYMTGYMLATSLLYMIEFYNK